MTRVRRSVTTTFPLSPASLGKLAEARDQLRRRAERARSEEEVQALKREPIARVDAPWPVSVLWSDEL
jgi:hypothetical protein